MFEYCQLKFQNVTLCCIERQILDAKKNSRRVFMTDFEGEFFCTNLLKQD